MWGAQHVNRAGPNLLSHCVCSFLCWSATIWRLRMCREQCWSGIQLHRFARTEWYTDRTVVSLPYCFRVLLAFLHALADCMHWLTGGLVCAYYRLCVLGGRMHWLDTLLIDCACTLIICTECTHILTAFLMQGQDTPIDCVLAPRGKSRFLTFF